MSEVTKLKNEGRVAAGKRLAEWNRKNKENLLKNKEKVESSDDSSASSVQQEPTSQTIIYGSGVFVIFAVIGVALYIYHGKKSAPTTTSAEPDIFCMN